MPRKYARHNRKKRKLTTRQQAFVKELAQGKTLTQAAKTAGYTDKNPAQAVRRGRGVQAARELCHAIVRAPGIPRCQKSKKLETSN